jgi:hypothetical protein
VEKNGRILLSVFAGNKRKVLLYIINFMSNAFAERVIDFKRHLYYPGKLPSGFRVMNPYLDNPETIVVMEEFYRKYYSDNNLRKFIIGINPSRHGAGVTGVPFTDTNDWKLFAVSK